MVRELDALKFNKACSKELKAINEIKPPEWSQYAKTGSHRKFPPADAEWWYTRASSVLRRIYLDGPVGVQRLRTFYGGRKDRGHKPERFRRSGGGHIRKILQQLEAAGFVQKNEQGKRGKVMSKKGMEFINKVSAGAK
ncbi:30S ribosomal protein S19e [Candidatus Micrarchaeota archaeon RBG_16_49_10]|nr:MAG: 30S ribosomal protein S19e [Candidatus Micrarchaeota archaeon RBG_16_49_10]